MRCYSLVVCHCTQAMMWMVSMLAVETKKTVYPVDNKTGTRELALTDFLDIGNCWSSKCQFPHSVKPRAKRRSVTKKVAEWDSGQDEKVFDRRRSSPPFPSLLQGEQFDNGWFYCHVVCCRHVACCHFVWEQMLPGGRKVGMFFVPSCRLLTSCCLLS